MRTAPTPPAVRDLQMIMRGERQLDPVPTQATAIAVDRLHRYDTLARAIGRSRPSAALPRADPARLALQSGSRSERFDPILTGLIRAFITDKEYQR